MTNEIESEVQNSQNTAAHIPHQQCENGTNSCTNDEPKRKVSMSQSTIDADNEKQKRKSSSSFSTRSVHSSTDNTNNCYVNPTFQSCSTGTSISEPFVE